MAALRLCRIAHISTVQPATHVLDPAMAAHIPDGVGEREGFFRPDAQQMKSQALRGFLADSRKALQLIDEFRDGFGEVGH